MKIFRLTDGRGMWVRNFDSVCYYMCDRGSKAKRWKTRRGAKNALERLSKKDRQWFFIVEDRVSERSSTNG